MNLPSNFSTLVVLGCFVATWSFMIYVCARERRRVVRLSSSRAVPLDVIILIAGANLLVDFYCIFVAAGAGGPLFPASTILQEELPALVLGAGILVLLAATFGLYILGSRWIPRLREEVRRQEETAQQYAFYRGVFDSMRDIVTVHDKDFNILALNAVGEESLKVSASDVVGRKCFEAYHGGTEPCEHCPALRTLHTKQQSHSRHFSHVADEHVDVRSSPVLDDAGKVIATIQVARVISDEIRLEKRQAEVDAMKRRLLALASHEMRAPLTLISGHAEELADDAEIVSPREVRAQAGVIRSEAARLSEMVRDILETSRIEDGELALERAEVDLAAVCREAAHEVESEQEGRPVQIDVPDGLPRPLADPDKLRQVVRNLLENACKYSPQGGEVRVGLSHSDGLVEVAVRDHGVGIPADELDRVFEMFHRVRNRETRRVVGTGLGLYIAKRIVEAHGGCIWAESTPNVGSVFRFTLPLGDGQAEAEE